MLNVTDSNTTNDYDEITDSNSTDICKINENNIDILIPSLVLTIPCGLSFLNLMSLIVYTFKKPLINK